MPDIGDLIASATRPERTVRLCLRGDLAARVETLRERHRKASSRRTSLADNASDLERELAEAIAAAESATVDFRIVAVTRHRLSQIMADSPPRDGDDDDARAGYDREKYTWQMLRESIASPEMTDDQFTALIGAPDALGDGVLSPAQFQALDEAMAAVNFHRADIPF